jgi:hypothetical protein
LQEQILADLKHLGDFVSITVVDRGAYQQQHGCVETHKKGNTVVHGFAYQTGPPHKLTLPVVAFVRVPPWISRCAHCLLPS